MNLVLGLVVLGAAATAVWAGIEDPEGGVIEGLRRALAGEPQTKRSSAVGAAFIANALSIGTAAAGGGSGATPAAYTAGGGTMVSNATRQAVIDQAETWLGTPYRWGGNTREGVDCSGLTVAVYATVGVKLPRVSAAQALVGQAVKQAQALPGDLVFFGFPVHHVGIYLGNDTLLHAPRTGRTVSVESVWHNEPVQFRNVLGAAGATPAVAKTRKRKGTASA